MLPSTDRSTGIDNSQNEGTAIQTASSSHVQAIDESFKELLRSLRQYDTPKPKKKKQS